MVAVEDRSMKIDEESRFMDEDLNSDSRPIFVEVDDAPCGRVSTASDYTCAL